MSYTSLLIDTCTVRRYTEGPVDGYGIPTETWADHLTGQACRLESLVDREPGKEVRVGAEIVIADYTLFVQDIDVTERDRVVIDGLTYEVLFVESRSNGTTTHHKELQLRILR